MSNYPAPVVFLPGIMGSALRDEYPVTPETVWSALKMMLKDFDRITLHPDNPRFEVQEPARVVKDQPLTLVYSEFIAELRHNLSPQPDEPVPVFPFAYDWRRPLAAVEQELAAFVDEVIERTKLLRHYDADGYGKTAPAQVNLVGHSMGGMIITGYLKTYGFDKVSKVATIATPFRGSFEAVAKTVTGMAALGTSPGSSRERESARITPSLYHLLPSFDFANGTPGNLKLFNAAEWQPQIVESLATFFRMYGLKNSTENTPEQQAQALLAAFLETAQDYREHLESLSLPDSKQWLSIVGVGRKTRVGLGFGKDSQGRPRFDLEEDTYCKGDWSDEDTPRDTQTGDNTVPYFGARASFIPVEQVVCVTADDFNFWELEDRALLAIGLHSDLPNMNLVQRLVTSHIVGRMSGDVWGRRAPDLPSAANWDPPLAGLPEEK